jgi:hypothetical protein
LSKKIIGLRQTRGKNFLAREEIFPLKRMFEFMSKGYNKLGSMFIVNYFIK